VGQAGEAWAGLGRGLWSVASAPKADGAAWSDAIGLIGHLVDRGALELTSTRVSPWLPSWSAPEAVTCTTPPLAIGPLRFWRPPAASTGPWGARSRSSCCAFVFVDEAAEDVMAVELPHCGCWVRLFAALPRLRGRQAEAKVGGNVASAATASKQRDCRHENPPPSP
jgi:hypothetical protein